MTFFVAILCRAKRHTRAHTTYLSQCILRAGALLFRTLLATTAHFTYPLPAPHLPLCGHTPLPHHTLPHCYRFRRGRHQLGGCRALPLDGTFAYQFAHTIFAA